MSETNSALEREIGEIRRDPRALAMKQFIQHGRVTTYDHCLNVARLSSRMSKRLQSLSIRVDEHSLLRGAMLHDYFLYDWHHHEGRWHGYRHPAIAAQNAKRDFGLTNKEEAIILTHMWPLTLRHIPPHPGRPGSSASRTNGAARVKP